jgi:uncharacterized protein YjbI with pentapeptide repeats
MDEPESEHPQDEKPLTRDDVLRLIEEHGGPEGLGLRWANLREADLRDVDLHGANLQGADLRDANLQQANLSFTSLKEARLSGASLQGARLQWANLREASVPGASLQRADLHQANLQAADLHQANLQEADLSWAYLKGARLYGADFQRAHLSVANLQGANLSWAKLDRANLFRADLQEAALSEASLERADLRWADLRRARLAGTNLRDAKLDGANWGDYVLGEENAGQFPDAASAYRALKQWHTEAGMYDIAGEFHYREMEARRKLARKERRLPYALSMYLLRFLYGYGERPERVIAWVAAVILGFAVGHWIFGTVDRGFLDALYYSAVSFTALGYGAWAPEPQGWAGRFLGVGESLIGVFMMALFLVTFTRKMTR